MTAKNLLLNVVFVAALPLTAMAQQPGTWKAYMAYHDVEQIENAGNLMYVLASNNLYAYNSNDKSVQTFDKANLLSDCDISFIKYNKSTKNLLVVYSDYNMDLLSANGNVVNMPDYYQASMTDDKTIHHVMVNGIYAYLSTGFGVVKVNMRDGQISDTYKLGFPVNYSYIDNNSIFAASASQGLYEASLSSNLLDASNWKRMGSYKAPQTINTDSLNQVVNQLGINPGGPKYNYFGVMKFRQGKLYTTGAGYNVTSDMNRPGTVQILNADDTWQVLPDTLEKTEGVAFEDNLCIEVDPADGTHVFTGGKNGLWEFRNGNFVKLWNYSNSPIENYAGKKDKKRNVITSLAYDGSNNLWVINSMAPTQSILEYTATGTWNEYKQNALMKNYGHGLPLMQGLFLDSRNLLWFVNNNYTYPAYMAYQPSTNALNVYNTFVNEDGTNVSPTSVECIAEAQEGIWIGTNMGPLLLEPDNITNYQYITQIKIPRNDGTDYADYLLSGTDVACIAVDAQNRKWIGTNGEGVYLISSDNMTQVQHFTAENSKLLSDYIESIAINSNTGEVYIGTDKGLCSYMSDVNYIHDTMTKDNVWAYPNPVKADYTGYITIVGLSVGADVKIVSTSGRLVAEGKSANGGTFKWNGRDTDNHRVGSGIYMVMTADNEGNKGAVCKIAVIN